MSKKIKILLFFALGTALFFMTCKPNSLDIEDGARGQNGYLSISFREGQFPAASYTDTKDAKLNDTDDNINYGDCVGVYVGVNSSEVNRMTTQFDINGYLPGNAKVEKAVLTLYSYLVTTGDPNFTAYKLTQSWTEGTGACGGTADVGASWLYYDGVGNVWTTNGGDFDSTPVSNTASVPSDDYFDLVLNTAMVQDWLDNPSDNYGVLIKTGDESGTDDYTGISTNENGVILERPMLTIYYSLE